jgi:SAM-dependent methyltransferase
METGYCDVRDFSSFPRSSDGYDTVVCLNVIEHIDDDRQALRNIRNVLTDAGTAIVLVPQGQWNFGTLDEVLGHRRRYSKKQLKGLAEDCGFRVKTIFDFNRVGTPAWFLNGKILRRRHFGLLQVWLLDILTPLFRRIDPVLPFPGLSLIAVLERDPAAHEPNATTVPADLRARQTQLATDSDAARVELWRTTDQR